jgi:hypothetical protein
MLSPADFCILPGDKDFFLRSDGLSAKYISSRTHRRAAAKPQIRPTIVADENSLIPIWQRSVFFSCSTIDSLDVSLQHRDQMPALSIVVPWA